MLEFENVEIVRRFVRQLIRWFVQFVFKFKINLFKDKHGENKNLKCVQKLQKKKCENERTCVQ